MRTPALAFALSLAVALAALAAMLAAQQRPTPTLDRENILASTPAPVEAVPVGVVATAPDATLVILPDGAPAVAVAVPPDAQPEEVKAIAETNAETQRDVASGEVPLAVATRDVSNGIDLGGQPLLFVILAGIFGMIFRPLVNMFVESHPGIDNRLPGVINGAAFVVVYTAAWALLHSSHPNLPQQWEGWMVMGTSSTAGGSVASSVIRSVSGWLRKSKPAAGAKP